jgi:hypothetical protein
MKISEILVVEKADTNSIYLFKEGQFRTYELNPAAKTESIGVLADASAGWRIMVFASQP